MRNTTRGRRAAGTVAVAAAALLLAGTALGQAGSQAGGGDGTWEMRVCADPNSLPFSSRDATGFENEIAEILAEELDAELTYDWYPWSQDLIDFRLRQGECDVIMGVPDGYGSLLTTLTYYRSPYVFVYRADSPFEVASLDDPVLRELTIGVQNVGIPPHQALVGRGLGDRVTNDYASPIGLSTRVPIPPVMEAVANGDVDVGIAWGPVAGYAAQKLEPELELVPITPAFEPPLLYMSFPMTIGVRRGDEALRDRLNVAIARRWEEIQGVLQEFGVPVEPQPAPRVPGAGA